MQNFIRLVDCISEWSGKIIALLIIPMILIIIYTALMRYLFNVGVNWGFEMSLFCYGIHAILGGAYCLKHGGHVSVDILPSRLPFIGQKICEIIGMLVTCAVVVTLFWLGSVWAWKSTLILERSIHGTIFNPYIWWFKWVVPIAALLIALQALAEICRNIMAIRNHLQES